MSLKYLMIATLLVSALAGQAQEAEPRLDIIPEPREVKHVGDSSFQLRPGTPVRVNDAALDFTASYLAGYTDRYLGIPLQAVPSPKKGKRKASAADEAGCPGICLENLSNGGPEGGYVLRVSADGGVRVSGNDAAGVFYGVQTLIQMLPTRAGVLPFLPEVEIADSPRFGYRGMHLDVVRHFFPVEYIKRYIDFLAWHKLNYFHWHLTDDQAWRLELKSHPELTAQASTREGEIFGLYPGTYHPLPYGGFYTQDDVREVVRYAAERHITVIPEIDIPGHCMAVLSVHPEFSTTPDEPKKCAQTWGIFNKFNNVLAPKPEVFSFLRDVFAEVCDLFPGQYVHVGGDECAKRWWKDSPETQQFMKENGLKDEKALQSYFIHFVQGVVNEKGKTLIGWDEILEGGISEDCVVMNWRRPQQGAKAIRTGHRTIFTSSGWSYFNTKESRTAQLVAPRGPLSLKKVYSYPIVPDSLTAGQEKLVWGTQACLWTEYIPTTWKVEYFLFPRISALAENAWSVPERRSWENFSRKMSAQFDRYDLWGVRYSEAFFRTEDVERVR